VTITSFFLIDLAPEWLLLLGACACLVVGISAYRMHRFVSPVALVTLLASLIAAVLLPRFGCATHPPGLQVTPLTDYVRCITLGMGLLIVLVNWRQSVAEERGEYMSMILFSLLGVLLTASANDLIVLFFAIELVSIPTYVLIGLSREDKRAPESAVKYFFLGAMSTAILAYGLSFLYGAAGTTTMHALSSGASNLPLGPQPGGSALIGLLLVVGGLAFKVAAVPLHVYAPDVYEGAASPVTALLGFVPKMAGFAALIKVAALCDWSLPTSLQWVLWAMAAATMTAGNVLALLQTNVKRMLAYSSIAHTGYMLIALLVGPHGADGPLRDGAAALLFYIAVYGVMNLGAFALLAAFQTGQRSPEDLDDLAGLATIAPWPALAFAVCLFSLMGFPPTAGFLGKFYIFSSALSVPAEHSFSRPILALAIIGVVNTAIGVAYYLRIVAVIYGRSEGGEAAAAGGRPVRWGLGLSAVLMLILFAWPAGLAAPARRAGAAIGGRRDDRIHVTAATLQLQPDLPSISSRSGSDTAERTDHGPDGSR